MLKVRLERYSIYASRIPDMLAHMCSDTSETGRSGLSELPGRIVLIKYEVYGRIYVQTSSTVLDGSASGFCMKLTVFRRLSVVLPAS